MIILFWIQFVLALFSSEAPAAGTYNFLCLLMESHAPIEDELSNGVCTIAQPRDTTNSMSASCHTATAATLNIEYVTECRRLSSSSSSSFCEMKLLLNYRFRLHRICQL